MKIFFPIAAICFFSRVISAQTIDTVKSPAKYPFAESFPEADFSPDNLNYSSIDTSLDGIQKYFPNNFPYSLGLANRQLSFEPSNAIGFRSGIRNQDLFEYSKETIKYYRTRTPYTEIFGVFGMKKEQFSRILHTQNITKQWNIALSMLRIRSEGFYQRQNCTDNNISLSTNYFSKSNRYSLLANGMISSVKADENGGIKPDSLSDDIPPGNKKLIPVSLPDARTKRQHREIYIKQSLHFGRKENVMKGDSIIGSRIKPNTSISYSFNMSDDMFAYTESSPDSGYYENVFFDSVKTLDSTHIAEIANGLEFKTVLLKQIKINLGAELKNANRIVQYNADSSLALNTHLSDQIVHLEMGSNNKSKGFFWHIGKRYILKGDHKGDDYVCGTIGLITKKNKKLSFEYKDSQHSVPYIYDYYNSNHFWWKNSFDKVTERTTAISYRDTKHKFMVSARNMYINNYVYFDSTFSPSLSKWSDYISYYVLSVKKDFHLKHLGFNNLVTWNSLHDEPETTLHLPEFVTNHSIYYEGKWFKKVTDVQLGFDVTYFSAYYADAYMPALGQYYLQHEKKIGNYPYIDFFFNMKIKHARLFVKSEHVNAGLMGQNYYLAPHMPGPDRSIKVGVKWMFFD